MSFWRWLIYGDPQSMDKAITARFEQETGMTNGIRYTEAAVQTPSPIKLPKYPDVLIDTAKAYAAGDEFKETEKKTRDHFQALYTEKMAKYNLECKRFGDFLTVIEYNQDYWGGKFTERQYALNLGKTDKIEFTPGHAPQDESMRFLCWLRTVDPNLAIQYNSSCSGGYSQSRYPSGFIFGSSPPPDNMVYYIAPEWTAEDISPKLPNDLLPASSRYYGFRSGGTAFGHCVQFPHHDKASIIYFTGLGEKETVKLSVPFGHGTQVYNRIIREIGDYYDTRIGSKRSSALKSKS